VDILLGVFRAQDGRQRQGKDIEFQNRDPTLRSSEERLPSGAQKEEFGRMIFEKNLPWRTILNFSQQCRQVVVEAPERVSPRVDEGEFWTALLWSLE